MAEYEDNLEQQRLGRSKGSGTAARSVRSSKGRTAGEIVARKGKVIEDITRLSNSGGKATEIVAKQEELNDLGRELNEIEVSTGMTAEQIIRTPSPPVDVNIEEEATRIAHKMVKEQQKQNIKTTTGRIFTRFDLGQDVVENQQDVVTAGIWSGNIGTLTSFFTSSTQTSTQKKYYYEVFQSQSSAEGAEAQFSVAYGHYAGSGSTITNYDYVTQAIYSQYKSLLLDSDEDYFSFNSVDRDQIYAINFNRARLKERLDPGNMEICLANLSGDGFANNVFTGSHVSKSGDDKIYHLIDDSGDSTQTVTLSGVSGKIYNVVSGSIANGIYNSTAPHYYGKMYPDVGIVILDAYALNESCSFNTVTGSNVAGDNAMKLLKAISASAEIDSTNCGFSARNEEKITSTHYFVRVKNGEYNFSNNPTWTTGSVGSFRNSTFVGDPKTYITTIGLYNDRQELLAVAKLSQPVLKSFSNEALIKVKLQF